MEKRLKKTGIMAALLLVSLALMAGALTGKTSEKVSPAGSSSVSFTAPQMEWNRTYGGIGEDVAYSVVQTSDGGYALAGSSGSVGARDAWLVKTDAAGNQVWNHTYRGAGDDEVQSVNQTKDGGYVLAGWTNSWGEGNFDFWLVKTDEFGNHLWNKTYGGSNSDKAYCVVQTSDDGYALAGTTKSYGAGNFDFWLVKTNSSGGEIWRQHHGGTDIDVAYSLVQTDDGGYALAGQTDSFGGGNFDFWLVKTNSTGNMTWNKTYGKTTLDFAYSVVRTSDGGYALAGATGLGPSDLDFWLVKTDAYGNHLWNKTYGGTGAQEAHSVVRTSDGGYALAGETYPSGTFVSNFSLVKTDSAGSIQWNGTYGGTGEDWAYSVVQTSDGGYVMAGSTDSLGASGYDFYLVKARSCTLTISTTIGGTTNPSPGNSSYAVGTNVTVSATANTSYLFDHWQLDGENVGAANPMNVTMNTDHSLLAVFKRSYTLTITATAGGTTNPALGTHIYGEGTAVSVSATANDNYLFDHWELDGKPNGTANPINLTMNANHTLRAFFNRTYTLTITVYADGTTDPIPGTHIYKNGTIVAITASPGTGYQLDHWELDGRHVLAANPYQVTMNATHLLRAVFAPIEYKLTIAATAGGTTNPAVGMHYYPYGTVVTVTALPSTNYHLVHWELDGAHVGAANPTQIAMTANHLLRAVFALPYDVAVTNVTSPRNETAEAASAPQLKINVTTITVTVTNQGIYDETFNVTLYYNNTHKIGVQTVPNLAPDTDSILIFKWNTTGMPKANHTLSAVADTVEGETDTANNVYTDHWILITIAGDVNADRKVELKDVYAVAKAYGSVPGHPRWSLNCDLNDDGKVELKDYYTTCKNYGKSW
jgi:hypothetical protein